MATFTGIAAGIGAAAALASAGNAIVQGEQSNAKQRKGLRQQADAQKQAESAAVTAARRTEEETARARRKGPDAASLIGEQQSPLTGLFTGASGVNPRSLTLGRKSLLGS